jgi:hypothetical protein
MTQTEQILAELKRGPITPLEALEKCGCLRLAARVSDLKAAGHTILTERVSANGKTYARYRLA